MSHTCCANVYYGLFSMHFRLCWKNAKYERDGNHYCGIHDPVTVAEKRKARDDEWRAEREDKRKQEKITADSAVEQKRRADCYDDLLAALQDISGFDQYEPAGPAACRAQSAIDKATGTKP